MAKYVADPAKHELKHRYYVYDIRDMLVKMDELAPGPDGIAILQLFVDDITVRHQVCMFP